MCWASGTLTRLAFLFCFLVLNVCLAPLTELFNLKAILKLLLVLVGAVSTSLALGALQIDEIILRHSIRLRRGHYTFTVKLSMEPPVGLEPTTYSLQNCCSTN